MLNDLVNGIFNFFIFIFTIITNPLQTVINSYFPSLNDFASSFVNFFDIINTSWIPWIKDLTFLPQWAFDLMLGYLVFKFVTLLTGNVLKIVLKWWTALVP